MSVEATLFGSEGAFDQPELHTDAFAAATEHWLDDGSWITHVPGFVSGHEEFMRQLSELHGWEQRSRWMYDRVVDEPRLTNEYRDLAKAPPMLIDIASALSDFCEVRYDGVWMNWYRDNRDSTSWHADRPANKPLTAAVPVLSLGAARRFFDSTGTRWKEHRVHSAGGRRTHHARSLPTRLAAQRAQATGGSRRTDEPELQQQRAARGLAAVT